MQFQISSWHEYLQICQPRSRDEPFAPPSNLPFQRALLTLRTEHLYSDPRLLTLFACPAEPRGKLQTNNPPPVLALQQLEKLSYLTIVIKEPLLPGFGVPGRLPRMAPPEGLTLSGLVFQAGRW
jgi:hypothetical protein